MQVREQPSIDHSLNLSAPPDRRDEGWGIAVEPDGEVHQNIRLPDEDTSLSPPRDD